MGMIWTTLGFAALSAMFVATHSRRSRRVAEAHIPEPCPRCLAAVPPGSRSCPACGVPMHVFDLVSAPMASAAPAATGPAHAIVRADMCVGCGTCVAACPEEGAIRIENKIAVVNLKRCVGHATCAAACPVNAIVVTTGAAVHVIEVPWVNAHFESNVAGLYVVGELGGRGLIKNAINEGKIAVEHVATVLRPEEPRAGESPAYDLVIVGSGPAGLSAALEAKRRGLRYVVLEQGSLSDSIRKYPRQKLLLAEPVRMPLYGDLWVSDASKETLLQVWENVIAQQGLDIRTGQRVERIDRDGGLFRVATAGGEHHARCVVLAMGRRGTPRRLGVAGEDLDKVYFEIVEMEAFAGSRVLVVGGGDSAIESALGLANQPDTSVVLSYRGSDLPRLKERNRAKLEAAVAAGRVRILPESQVREIRPDVVVLDHRGRPHLEPNDVVIVRIGGEAPYPFLERLGVRIVRKEIALGPARAASLN